MLLAVQQSLKPRRRLPPPPPHRPPTHLITYTRHIDDFYPRYIRIAVKIWSSEACRVVSPEHRTLGVPDPPLWPAVCIMTESAISQLSYLLQSFT
jgi:hypothetical protein